MSKGEESGRMDVSARGIPRRRRGIGTLSDAGALADYIDRLNLPAAAPRRQVEFHTGAADMGLQFSAFWSGAYPQIPEPAE